MPPKKFLIIFGVLLILIPITLFIYKKSTLISQNTQQLNSLSGTITKIDNNNITIKSKSPKDKLYTFKISPSAPINTLVMDPSEKPKEIKLKDLKIGDFINIFTKSNSEVVGISLITYSIVGTIVDISDSNLTLNTLEINSTGEPPIPGKEKYRLVKIELTNETQVVGDLKKDQRVTVTSHQDATSDTFTAFKIVVSEPLAIPPGQLTP